jgi:hypothetical protein
LQQRERLKAWDQARLRNFIVFAATAFMVQTILIRMPDKQVRRISIRKAGKETCNHILPAFLPSLLIFWQATG